MRKDGYEIIPMTTLINPTYSPALIAEMEKNLSAQDQVRLKTLAKTKKLLEEDQEKDQEID